MSAPGSFEKQHSSKQTGYGSYLECVTRGFLVGCIAFGSTVSVTYFTQIMLKGRIPYKKKYYMPLSFLIGGIIAARVLTVKSKYCSAAWSVNKEIRS